MHLRTWVWAGPLSLATTQGVAIAFLSWSYLDVSVHSVGPACAVMVYEDHGVAPFGHLRIKAKSAAPRSFSQLSHVLHRLLMPRHPPKALTSLTYLLSHTPSQLQTQTSLAAPGSLSTDSTRQLGLGRDFRLSTLKFSKKQGSRPEN